MLILTRISSYCIQRRLDLNIDPVTIPEGCTDIMQPLDHRIFGVMKAKQRSYLEKRLTEILLSDFDFISCSFRSEIEKPDQISKKEAASLFHLIFDEVTELNILEAFDETIKQYFPILNDHLNFSEDDDFELRLKLRSHEIIQERKVNSLLLQIKQL